MKRFKKVLLSLLGVLLIFVFFLFVFINSLKPTYNGTKELNGITAEVKVYYDTYGIPHIYALTDKDAYKALGYVHAQDRLWQMELMRRIAKGGLSEVFGKDLLSTDKFMLSLGIDEHAKETVANLDKDGEMAQLSLAYLEGINTFIEEGPTPIEFYLTGLDKTPFKLEDMYNTVGYMAFSFAQAHKTDPLLTHIKENLGYDYIKNLAIDADTVGVRIKSFTSSTDSLSKALIQASEKALAKLPIPKLEGSNSWVLGPKKTKSGQVIFANDPHIGFAQPSVWYEAHVKTPTYEKYGYHLAGIPFPLLGHDRNIAYGLTMFQNDDINFYYETPHPTDSTQYKTPEGWASYNWVDKTIKVKGEKDVKFSYKVSRHGPILNGIANQINGDKPVAMYWVYTQKENKVLEGLHGMIKAKDINSFKSALPNIHAPGLNVMYGDKQGNVAWWASAALYKMPDSVNTKFILNGVSGKDEPVEWLDFSKNPRAINPDWGYVYSANNQPDTIAGNLYPGYYLPDNRAKRIVSLLEPKDDWDVNSTQKMITDVTSAMNAEIINSSLRLVDVSPYTDEQLELLDMLNSWKGDYPLNSIAATFYHRCVYYVFKNSFEDELGPELFSQFMETNLMKRHLSTAISFKDGKWWDDVNTNNKVETKEDVVIKSIGEAYTSLVKDFGPDYKNWTWDKVHTIEFEHPIGKVKILRSFFNVGPFPVEGSREVINNMSFPYDDSGFYKVSSGPSTRRVIDFSNIDESVSILPTGQSGNPFSSHYKDQTAKYLKGEFRKMLMNKKEIQEKSKNVLVLKPLK
ncbi:penicillin acylase family protein [Croceivirga sp. JEA036]|uniref:penicillin acylase family protein n=1 Tax=Croceivirga sp. JEA036 TaxID=2721162 RepID=UPI00143C6F00|nr:penicillin acylase family protein [Croceivirga sp. JEA036]NJB35776.1 penicillin acylase family protein [Croceivirga sp. JEA036]